MSDQLLSREEELRKSRDKLEERVQERTAELEIANNELKQMPSKLLVVQEEERIRLAVELHDSIMQTLVAIKIKMEHIIIKLQDGVVENALNALRDLVPTLIDSINETRAIYIGLRPNVLEDFGVIAALRWHCEEQLKLHPERHIELMIDVNEVQIPKHLHVPIFRVAQEALNNIARHSEAEWVEMALTSDGDRTEFVISDDGIGMDLGETLKFRTDRGLGLACMRERVEMIGGCLSIESTPGKGTTIRVSWSNSQFCRE